VTVGNITVVNTHYCGLAVGSLCFAFWSWDTDADDQMRLSQMKDCQVIFCWTNLELYEYEQLLQWTKVIIRQCKYITVKVASYVHNFFVTERAATAYGQIKKQFYEMFEISVQMTKKKVIPEISLVLVPANVFLQKSTAYV